MYYNSDVLMMIEISVSFKFHLLKHMDLTLLFDRKRDIFFLTISGSVLVVVDEHHVSCTSLLLLFHHQIVFLNSVYFC